MKVSMPKDQKIYTGYQLDMMKAVIEYEKTDGVTAREWAAMAVREALKDTDSDGLEEIISAAAETALNSRAWNNYSDDSGNGDVWIECIAKTWFGFIEVGVYLSDVWQTGAVDYKQHEFIRYYKRSDLE